MFKLKKISGGKQNIQCLTLKILYGSLKGHLFFCLFYYIHPMCTEKSSFFCCPMLTRL